MHLGIDRSQLRLPSMTTPRNEAPAINPAAATQRGLLRLGGIVLLAPGLVLTLLGGIDFFATFQGGGFPTKFWCLFVGLPLVGFGMALLKAGFFGAAARYAAGEVVPVLGDSVQHLAASSTGVVEDLARQLKDGGRETAGPTVQQRLEQLEQLRAGGLIQPHEYETQRKRILSEI